MILLQPVLAFFGCSSKFAILFHWCQLGVPRNERSRPSCSGKSARTAVLTSGGRVHTVGINSVSSFTLSNTALPSKSSGSREPTIQATGIVTHLHSRRYAGPAARLGPNLPPQPYFFTRGKCKGAKNPACTSRPFLRLAVDYAGTEGAVTLVLFGIDDSHVTLDPQSPVVEKDSG